MDQLCYAVQSQSERWQLLHYIEDEQTSSAFATVLRFFVEESQEISKWLIGNRPSSKTSYRTRCIATVVVIWTTPPLLRTICLYCLVNDKGKKDSDAIINRNPKKTTDISMLVLQY